MFKLFKPSNVIIPTSPKRIRISYNDEKCYKCNSKSDLTTLSNDDSISYCKNCNINIVLYRYMYIDDYHAIVKRKVDSLGTITKDTLENFTYTKSKII